MEKQTGNIFFHISILINSRFIFSDIFTFMERYKLLQTIYEIAKVDPRPETYACRPRELILRLMQDWSVIQQHLKVLEEEGLIRTIQQDILIIYISPEGIQKLAEIKATSFND